MLQAEQRLADRLALIPKQRAGIGICPWDGKGERQWGEVPLRQQARHVLMFRCNEG
jgi:hypothetical protein